MCVIIVKSRGVKMPPTNVLKECWNMNRDGAGIAYVDGGNVHIAKGFMTFPTFYEYLQFLHEYRGDLTETEMVFHFRMGTSGGVLPGLTHPFPLTVSTCKMGKLQSAVRMAVFHNGVIPNYTPPQAWGTSDTMEYIRQVLAPMGVVRVTRYKTLLQVQQDTASKWVFMTAKQTYMAGPFYNVDGALYSNLRWIK